MWTRQRWRAPTAFVLASDAKGSSSGTEEEDAPKEQNRHHSEKLSSKRRLLESDSASILFSASCSLVSNGKNFEASLGIC